MKKLLLFLCAFGMLATSCNGGGNGASGAPANEIWYTTVSALPLAPTKVGPDVFGANIISNTYEEGRGVLRFDAPVTKIGYGAFAGCSSLTSITIPDSVTLIEDYAFQSCSSLTSVTIPDSVTSIGGYAFQFCDNLKRVTIPASVTSIGHYAFDCAGIAAVDISSIEAWCKITFGSSPFDSMVLYLNGESVTDLVIPDGVTEIGDYAFAYCSSLTSVTIPDSVTEIGERAFESCWSLTSVTIPDSVTEIGASAFFGCSLTSITIPDGVTEIGACAFFGCDSLTSVTIPDSVTSIGGYAFAGCSLTSVTIPDSVTEIETGAFIKCSSLKVVYCKPTTPPTLGRCVFDSNASDRKIYVPTNSVSAYKSAGGYWYLYADAIVGYNF